MSKKKKKKHLKDFRKDECKRDPEKLSEYLNKYGDSGSAQPYDKALYDPQIKTLSLPLSEEISSLPQGTVFDIGCGNGILLKRLVEINAFRDSSWIYFATDYEEKIKDVLKLAVDIRMHRRCEACELEKFYSEWPNANLAPKPYVAVIRNVFHEIDIYETAKLLHHVVNNFQKRDILFVQDLEVFPVGERGNACWLSNFFNNVLNGIGFKSHCIEEPTLKGNRWFTAMATRDDTTAPDYDTVRKIILSERTNQYKHWLELGWLVPDDQVSRDIRIAKVDFDLQCAALHKQLRKVQPDKIGPMTKEQQSKIVKELFSQQLRSFTTLSYSPIKPPRSFRDRKQEQNKLEEFLRDDSSVVIVRGGPFTGKTVLVQEVLSHRAYEKQIAEVDIQYTSSVWNLIEQFLSSIGYKISYELISGLPNISFSDIKDEIEHFVTNISDKIIVGIDHFERLLNYSSKIADNEIKEFLEIIVNAPKSKLILTTRRDPNLDFINPDKFSPNKPYVVGRFPEGTYVVNVLDDFVDRVQIGIKEYPEELLNVIDRHPYLTVLSGMIIKKEGKECLENEEFLYLVKNRLREELLSRVVDERTRPLIEFLSKLRIAVPIQMLESLAGKDSVKAAVEDCLIYDVYDYARRDLYRGIGVFRNYGRDEDSLDLSQEFIKDKTEEEKRSHESIAQCYAKLYREDKDPRWVRELYYHTIIAGEPEKIKEFGVVYVGEIFWAGDFWFKVAKKYKDALWAFLLVHKLGLKNDFTQMRLAGCLMRVQEPDKEKEGEDLYKKLIQEDDQSRSFKTSYIDSLLHLKRYSDALDRLNEYGFEGEGDAWIIHEYGRAYFGLHQYRKAVEAFEKQLKLQQDAFVYDILARAYHKLGDDDNMSRVLSEGLNRHKTNKRLILTHASKMILSVNPDVYRPAFSILEDLMRNYPTDGRILQQYCKLLCKDGRVSDARDLWEKYRNRIFPEAYRLSIHIEILSGEKKWGKAIEQLKEISPDDEHLVGRKRKVYLLWARSETDEMKSREIAINGLNVRMDVALENNIPIMVTSARLAKIAGNTDEFQRITEKIDETNSRIADMLIHEDEKLLYWEDDLAVI